MINFDYLLLSEEPMNTPNYKEEYKKLLGALPSWLRDEMPTFVPHYTLVSASDAGLIDTDKGYTLLTPEGHVYKVYEAVGGELHSDLKDIEGKGFYIHLLGPEDNFNFLGYETEDGNYSVFVPSSQLETLSFLVDSVNESLQAARDYRQDPTDFYSAYNFLDTHMSMWTNNQLNNPHRPMSRILAWLTEGIVDAEMTLTVYKDIPVLGEYDRPASSKIVRDMGVVTFMLEGGPHIGRRRGWESGAYADCCVDIRLVSFAPSFEDTIIEYARKLDERYDEWGNERG